MSCLTQRGCLSKKFYEKIIAPDLILKSCYRTPMNLPSLDKIVLNTTSKHYVHDKKNIIFTLLALQLITGRKPVCTHAQKSIANFKIRHHQLVGCCVVLRGQALWRFVEKLSKVGMPGMRDLKSLSSCDFGIQDPLVFPELETQSSLLECFGGMTCGFGLSNTTPKTAPLLLTGFQFPVNAF